MYFPGETTEPFTIPINMTAFQQPCFERIKTTLQMPVWGMHMPRNFYGGQTLPFGKMNVTSVLTITTISH
jgi:hypothetical protein